MVKILDRALLEGNDIIKKIKNFEELRAALVDLERLVEMREAKTSVMLQLKYLLSGRKDKNDMLHTVIYGPPGVGKTQLGKILSRFYYALGLLTPGKKEEDNQLKKIYDTLLPTLFVLERSNEEEVRDEANILGNLLAGIIPQTFEKQEGKLVVVSRVDFVAEFCGASALKTKRLLEDNIGNVLFIDEAYSLVFGDRDSFGMEALTTLNLFMSERPKDIIVIFAGYKDMLENSIFKYQPGLKRRCTWTFNIEPYSADGLCKIFKEQLRREGMCVEDDVNLSLWFKERVKDFPGFGGDTQRLLFYCKLYSVEDIFNNMGKRKRNDDVISGRVLDISFNCLKNNTIQEKEKDAPMGMYI